MSQIRPTEYRNIILLVPGKLMLRRGSYIEFKLFSYWIVGALCYEIAITKVLTKRELCLLQKIHYCNVDVYARLSLPVIRFITPLLVPFKIIMLPKYKMRIYTDIHDVKVRLAMRFNTYHPHL